MGRFSVKAPVPFPRARAELFQRGTTGLGEACYRRGRVLTRDWPPHERDLSLARFDLKADQTLGFHTAWVRVGACCVQRAQRRRWSNCPTRCQDVVNWSNEDRRLLLTGLDRLWQALTATGRGTGAGRPGSCCVQSLQLADWRDCRRSRRSLSDSLERFGDQGAREPNLVECGWAIRCDLPGVVQKRGL